MIWVTETELIANSEKSEAAPESSRFSSTWKLPWLLAGGNFPFPMKLSFPFSPPEYYRVQLSYQHHPFAGQYAEALLSELPNFTLQTKKLSTESKKCSLLL